MSYLSKSSFFHYQHTRRVRTRLSSRGGGGEDARRLVQGLKPGEFFSEDLSMKTSAETFSMARGRLTLGHSPDPDDAFMFYALAKHLIPTDGFGFEHILQDIQTLNERASRGELDISAISIHAYAYVLKKYALLPCGASIGDGYGPVAIVRSGHGPPSESNDAQLKAWLQKKRIAVPGQM